MSFLYLLVGALCALIVALLVYAFRVEPYDLRLREIDIPISNLPEPLDGFTIFHVSDIHTSSIGKLEQRLMDILSSVHADLGVITGDLVRKRKKPEAVKEVLSHFKARLGVYAVTGNSDYRLKVPLHNLVSAMDEIGIRFLMNSNVTCDVNGVKLQIIGVEDPFKARDDMNAAMAGLSDDGFRLLLAHSPDILLKLEGRRVDLILAGHTHGGQIRFPGIGALWLHCRHHLGISDGLYTPDELCRKLRRTDIGSSLYVSRGLGSSNIRARFLCPPEVTKITLRRKFEPGGE
ncbi:MAG TPA: metallophosphoesterase [Armatimonadota bacterium]|jgi:hypothetical protein